MKIKYIGAGRKIFYPAGYHRIMVTSNEVVELPDWLGFKLMREYPKLLIEYLEPDKEVEDEKVIIFKEPNLTYWDKRKLAQKTGYDGSRGWREETLDEVLSETE